MGELSVRKSSRDDLDVTLQVKAKHAALYAAAKKMGGNAALAKHLGLQPSVVGTWINLKAMPNPDSTRRQAGKWLDIEQKLFDLTGQTTEELFPTELRNNKDWQNSPKFIELTSSISTSTGMLTTDLEPSALAMAMERKEVMGRVLKTLSYREREIIKMRYGLGDGYEYTYDELGHIFQVTRERIRQIEGKALRKMQEPERLKALESV